MPIISVFFGITIPMYYDEHNPPHIHVEYHGNKALLDFKGNILCGDLFSRTALKLVREWIDIYYNELLNNWNLARLGQEIHAIDPLQ
jgi:hypothetical protein